MYRLIKCNTADTHTMVEC